MDIPDRHRTPAVLIRFNGRVKIAMTQGAYRPKNPNRYSHCPEHSTCVSDRYGSVRP